MSKHIKRIASLAVSANFSTSLIMTIRGTLPLMGCGPAFERTDHANFFLGCFHVTGEAILLMCLLIFLFLLFFVFYLFFIYIFQRI